MRDEGNKELEMQRAALSQTKEQQAAAVRSQRAVLKEEMDRERAAQSVLQQHHQLVDSARAREAQLQLRVEERKGGSKQ